MKTIKSIIKVIATIVLLIALVLATAEAETANTQLLWSGGCLLVLYISYKVLVWAGPSLLEDEDM